MKAILLTPLLFLLWSPVFGQKAGTTVVDTTSPVIFTQRQTIGVANGFYELKYRLGICDSLATKLDSSLTQCRTALSFSHRANSVADSVVSAQAKQITAYQNSLSSHQEIEKLLRQQLASTEPTWVESPPLWLGVGLTIGYLLFYRKN